MKIFLCVAIVLFRMNSHMYIDDVGRQGSLLADRTVTRMNLYTILGRSPKREVAATCNEQPARKLAINKTYKDWEQEVEYGLPLDG